MSVIETIEAFKSGLMWICLSALAAIAVGVVGAWLCRGVVSATRRLLTAARIVAFVAVSAFCVIRGGAKFLMSPPSTGGTPVVPVVVTPEEIAQGWRLAAETNCTVDVYAMPEGVLPTFNWHKRGTFGEWARLDLGDFAFPLGTNGGAVTSFSVFNDGRIRPTPRDAAREICAVGVPMLAMQGASRFWTADGISGSKLLTWEAFFLNADTNTPVNAQIELFQNGDFTARSNVLERIYRRVEPFDWDGDGLENTVDPDPLVAGADAHGTNAEWYNVVCSNVLEAVEGDGGVGLLQAFYVKPFTVSFSEIAVEEVPSTNGLANGYFRYAFTSNMWSHTSDAGAGEWANVSPDNRMGDARHRDEAALSEEMRPITPDGILTNDYSFGWMEGTMTWEVPFGWNAKGTTKGTEPFGTFEGTTAGILHKSRGLCRCPQVPQSGYAIC